MHPRMVFMVSRCSKARKIKLDYEFLIVVRSEHFSIYWTNLFFLLDLNWAQVKILSVSNNTTCKTITKVHKLSARLFAFLPLHRTISTQIEMKFTVDSQYFLLLSRWRWKILLQATTGTFKCICAQLIERRGKFPFNVSVELFTLYERAMMCKKVCWKRWENNFNKMRPLTGVEEIVIEWYCKFSVNDMKPISSCFEFRLKVILRHTSRKLNVGAMNPP